MWIALGVLLVVMLFLAPAYTAFGLAVALVLGYAILSAVTFEFINSGTGWTLFISVIVAYIGLGYWVGITRIIDRSNERRADENAVDAPEDEIDNSPYLRKPFDRLQTLSWQKHRDQMRKTFPEIVQSHWDEDILKVIVYTACQVGGITRVHPLIYRNFSTTNISYAEARRQIDQARGQWSQTIPTLTLLHATVILDLINEDDVSSALLDALELVAQISATGAEYSYKSADYRSSEIVEDLRVYMEHALEDIRSVLAMTAVSADDKPSSNEASDADQILGAHPQSSQSEVKAAYHRKIKEWHPDQLERMALELREYATQQLALINSAYQKLTRET